jgi:Fic family protein
MLNEKKWIWEDSAYPKFVYSSEKLHPLLQEIKYYQGLLNGIYTGINSDDLYHTQLEIMTKEIMDSSAIEGEILSRDSVRSSISKQLGINRDKHDHSTRTSDGVTDLLVDALYNFDKPMTEDRLFGWHNALFPTGVGRLIDIHVAQYREEEMQIVSGQIGRERVHYVAPPVDVLHQEMEQFLAWLNGSEDTIIKAGIAHLWFVIVHPFDDGNGRIARAIGNYILSKEAKAPIKFYSMSSMIWHDRAGYYDVLEVTTRGDVDISLWLEWFLQTLLKALKEAKESVAHVLQKTAFWDRHRSTPLNEREIKVLNRLLDVGEGNFEGGINTRKYASLTKVSKNTASRELKNLVEKECLIQIEGTSGRNIAYEVKYDK